MSRHGKGKGRSERGDHNEDGHADNGRGHGHHGRRWDNDRRNNDDDKHDGRGHGNGDHNGDGHCDNGVGGDVTPPPPPPPPPPAAMTMSAVDVADLSTSAAATGTDGADQMSGGNGNDTLAGGAGDDLLQGDGAAMISAPLDIAIVLTNVADPMAYSVTISGVPAGAALSAGTDNGDGSWTLSSAQMSGLSICAPDAAGFSLHVVATATDGSGVSASSDLAVSLVGGNADVLDGGDGNDYLDGGAGNDMLVDGAGNDVSVGGDGDDVFIPGAGNDSYSGGAGFDTIDFSGVPGFGPGGMYINLADGLITDQGNGTGDDVIAGVEGVVGSAGGDLMWGDGQANAFDGSSGDDVIIGGIGADTLTGGEGFDIFLIQNTDVVSAADIDTITDFAVGDTVLFYDIAPVSIVDDGQNTTLYGNVNGQVQAVVEFQGFTGYTLDDMMGLGMIA